MLRLLRFFSSYTKQILTILIIKISFDLTDKLIEKALDIF